MRYNGIKGSVQVAKGIEGSDVYDFIGLKLERIGLSEDKNRAGVYVSEVGELEVQIGQKKDGAPITYEIRSTNPNRSGNSFVVGQTAAYLKDISANLIREGSAKRSLIGKALAIPKGVLGLMPGLASLADRIYNGIGSLNLKKVSSEVAASEEIVKATYGGLQNPNITTEIGWTGWTGARRLGTSNPEIPLDDLVKQARDQPRAQH